MLFDVDININFDENWTVEQGGKALAFVIDENVVHTVAAKNQFYSLLSNFISGTDVAGREIINLSNSVVESESNLNFVKNGEVIESLSTTQDVLKAVLLSDPIIVVLRPEIERIGVEPGWKYINQTFSKN